MANSKSITRRDFIKGTAYGTLGLAMGLRGAWGQEGKGKKEEPYKTTVVLIRDEAAVDADHRVNSQVVQKMLDTAITTFSGEKDILKAWKKYIRPEDTVGVKYSLCGAMPIPTEEALRTAIVNRLKDIGIPPERIIVKDRDMDVTKVTALINVPPIKVHWLSGIAVSIKNYIPFSGKASSFHPDACAELGSIWLLPQVKGKTRLIIVDALRPFFDKGPQIDPRYRWDYKGILVGTDPVAIDTVCLKIAQEKRNKYKGEPWEISPPPKHIALADTKYKLGTSDISKIKLIKLGWKEEMLI